MINPHWIVLQVLLHAAARMAAVVVLAVDVAVCLYPADYYVQMFANVVLLKKILLQMPSYLKEWSFAKAAADLALDGLARVIQCPRVPNKVKMLY